MVDHLLMWGMLFAAWVPHRVSGRASAAAFFYRIYWLRIRSCVPVPSISSDWLQGRAHASSAGHLGVSVSLTSCACLLGQLDALCSAGSACRVLIVITLLTMHARCF